MAERNDEQLIRDAYIRMYEGMIAKDESILREVLDDSFVLVHMTGMRQPKEEFIMFPQKTPASVGGEMNAVC